MACAPKIARAKRRCVRESRIPHPPGERFVQLHVWAVTDAGFAPAAILGLLDFFDRRNEHPGELLATRARIIADLQGIVGRNAIDFALAKLVRLQWIRLHEITTTTGTNITTTHWYSLRPEIIAQHLVGRGTAGVPKSGHRSPPNGVLNREDHLLQEKENSSADANSVGKKVWSERPSGIVTWTSDDEASAARLEAETAHDDLAAAISTVRNRGKDPYPSLVAREVKKLRAQRSNAPRTRELREAAEAAMDKRLQDYLARQRQN
jgi:hypothetical protein